MGNRVESSFLARVCEELYLKAEVKESKAL